jgi:hypothetical protein
LLELSFTDDCDFQSLSTILAHVKTRAYLKRLVRQYAIATGLSAVEGGGASLSLSPSHSPNPHANLAINISALVSAQQLILPRGIYLIGID